MAENNGYTRTGHGFLQDWANRVSVLPFGGFLAMPLGLLDTAIETVQWVFRGNIASAATVAISGTVGNLVNGISATGDAIPLWWGARVGTAAVTGRTIGTHARALTENVIGGITQPLGVQPTILRSYVAGPGQIGSGFNPQRPGRWAQSVSGQRGRNPEQDWRAYENARAAEAQMGATRG